MRIIAEKIRPTVSTFENILSVSRRLRPSDEKLLEWTNKYIEDHSQRIAFDYDYIAAEFPDSRGKVKILEIGCAPLLLTTVLKNAGYAVTGIEIEPDRFKEVIERDNLDIVRHDVDGEAPFPFQRETFNAVIFNEIFEHLRGDKIYILKEIMRILKNKGTLFLSTPNLKSIQGIKNYIFHGKSYSCCGEIFEEYIKMATLGHMGHVREYTPQEVALFLKKMKLDIRQLIYRGHFGKKYFYIDRLFPQLRPFFTIVARKT